jgi:hypothetical protein
MESTESTRGGQPGSTATPGAPPARRELGYAPARPGERRGRVARRVALALLAAAAVTAAGWWHEPVLAHARLLNWQRQCGNHAFGRGAVVASSKGPGGTTAAAVPAYWAAYEAAAGRAAGMTGFAAGAGGPGPASGPTLAFLHGRRSPAGHERIVAVRCVPLYLTSASVLRAFQPVTVEPAAAWPPSGRPVLREGEFRGGYPVSAAVEVYGGQPDPTDASRFAIGFSVDGRPGVIDGDLRDDGTVRLRVRAGSADVYPRR